MTKNSNRRLTPRHRSRRARSRLAAAALVAPVVVAPGVLAAAPAQAAATCQGRTATIEAEDRALVRGTPGDDVIVTVDVVEVFAGDGDDVVCSSVNGNSYLVVYAGSGDDVVDTSATDPIAPADAELGPGNDTYRGGGAEDQVDTGDRRQPGLDIVSTRDGADTVISGARGRPNPDRVSLGAGGDDLFLLGRPTGSFVDAGRPGTVFAQDSRRLPWSIQLRQGRIRVGGGRAALEGFGIAFVDRTPFSRLSLRGTAGDDYVTVRRPRYAGPAPVDVDLLGGDDQIDLGGKVGGRVSLGAGDNWVDFTSSDPSRAPIRQDLSGSLERGVFRIGGARLRVDGIRTLGTNGFDRVDLTGDVGNDTLFVEACHADVKGGPGNDVLQASVPIPSSQCRGGAPGAVLRGQAGSDGLAGTEFSDVLLGGPGRDDVWDPNRRDRDVCVAESTRGC